MAIHGAKAQKAEYRQRRVVVTGLGVVSPAGWNVASFQKALNSGRTLIGPLTKFKAEHQRTKLAAQVPAPEKHTWLAQYGRGSPCDRFAVIAAREATQQASLPNKLSELSTGIFFGSSTGGLCETEAFYSRFLNTDTSQVDRKLLVSHHICSPAEAIARQLCVSGPVETISSACAAGGLAIKQAYSSVGAGEIDIALTGGADALTITTYSGFNSLRNMDENPCRPFQADRVGMSLGEGGAVLVVESLDHALHRGAMPLAEILGTGSSCDAAHMTSPSESGMFAAAAISEAIVTAGLKPSDIDYFNAHGTGTPHNDRAEYAALRLVFGNHLPHVFLEPTKSIVGHSLGAAGAIEAASTILCLKNQAVHPTAMEPNLDPDTPVNLSYGLSVESTSLRHAVSSSFGFGGANVAILFGRWEPQENV